MDVIESPVGLLLHNLSNPALSVTGVTSVSGKKTCWLPGDVVISCNGIMVQSIADLKRAMRFSDSQIVTLEVISDASINRQRPLAAGWLRKEMAGGRTLYENVNTNQVSWLHPELHLKPTVPMLVSLKSYNNGAFTPSFMSGKFMSIVMLYQALSRL